MWRASLVITSICSATGLSFTLPCCASDFNEPAAVKYSGEGLPKSASPDINGLPAPLNMQLDFGKSSAVQSNLLIPKVHIDNSDIHLYLSDKSPKSSSAKLSIDAIEAKCFSRVYGKDTTEQRVARLEQFVFGKTATNSSASLGGRLDKVATVVAPQKAETGATESENATSSGDGTVASAPSAPSLISVINSGIDHYNIHDYQRAEDDFEKCCAMAPDMARVHSYLAISKLQLNQRQAALEEFRTTYEIDPFGTYGRYAKLCLMQLAGDEEIRKRGPVDSNEVLQSSLDKINKQSEGMINFHNRESSRTPALPFTTASYIDGAIASQIHATSARNNTVLQNAFTQESANNLKHLMGLKSKPGNAHLRAWGTNLNTRYYGADTYLYAPYYIPREYPVELKAQQKSLSSKPSAVVKRKSR